MNVRNRSLEKVSVVQMAWAVESQCLCDEPLLWWASGILGGTLAMG